MSTSTSSLTDGQLRALGALLWQYRSGLERVEFLLEAQLVFASSGRDRRLASVADMLEEAADTINELDLRRELLLFDDEHPDAPIPAISELAASVEQPWSSMLTEHQRWLENCIGRIKLLLDQSRRTMSNTLDLINQLVSNETAPSVEGYDRSGRTSRQASPSVLFDSRA